MEDIFFHKGLERHECIGLILKGIYAGTAVGTGLTIVSAFVSPTLSVIVAAATAVGSGFATTYMIRKASEKGVMHKLQV